MTRNITDQTILNKKNTDICLFRQFIGVVIFSWLLICLPSTGNLPAPPGTRVAGPFPVPSERPPLLPVSADSGPDPFPRVEGLQPQVAFWRDVFTRYSRQQVLIHDNWYMGIIYEVVDLSQAGENRRAMVQAAVEKWSSLLKQASDQWDTPKEMSPEVRVIYRAFSDFPESPRFAKRDALKRLRVQTGQADSFRKGVVWSGRYLPSMKKILAEYELPEKLACMPLIESAFNTGAVSFVGAGGIWQLMPYVARQYGLKVGGMMDERRDPLIATRAAAQHLSTNFTELESWPLAITAYNHGLGGIKKAADTVGSKDIWQIAQNYESPSFGFASRNFYAEFLAALEIFDNPSKYYDGIEPDAPVITARFELPHWVAASALETSCGLPVDLLRDINPALLETAFRPGNFLPAGYALNIPVQQKDTITIAYAAMPDTMKYRYLGGQSLRVRRGQTLGNIARACGVSSGTIARINGLKRNRKLRSGQLLKLPGRYAAIGGNEDPQDTPVVEVAAVRPEKTEVPVKKAVVRKKQILKKPVLQAWLKHRVRSGETLLQIARKYGVSPRVIARHNALRDHSNIRIGQVLKIPEG